jgi:cytochrome c-type biogenesis protein CcmH/NrfG
MTQTAQNQKGNATVFTSVQAYTLAVITLVIGIAVGYFARGSAPGSAGVNVPESAQAAMATPPNSAPAASASGNMAPGQLPGSTPQQQAASPEMLAKAAEPLLAQLKANPNNADVLVQLGNLYYDGQSFPQAIEYYEKALKLQPNNADVRTDLGTSYWYTGDPDKALANFNKSLAIRPNHAGTLFNVGIVEWQGKKDPKAAVIAWEKLLQTNPDYPQKDQVQMLIERAKMHGAGTSKG